MKVVKSTKSPFGNKIELLKSENEKFDKKVLIIGVFHGDETDGEFLIEKYLETDPIINKNQLFIIPCLNPDGKSLKTRQNSNKIDLNRNFPTKNWILSDDKDYFGGNEPSSEIETKFVISILEEYDFDCILTLHSPYKVVNFDGPAEILAKSLSKLTKYPVQENIGYPTPGSFGTYSGTERNIPTITLELPENEERQVLWEQNKEIFDYLSNEF